MYSRFLQFGTDNSLFDTGNKTLLAVSGGLDSIVMLDLFLKAGFPISVAHCNFGLRGKESDDDAGFVKMVCKKNKIKFHSKKFKTESFAKKNKVSIQVAARELRYAWFRELMKKNDHSNVATAHHLDDSIETFFINILRGTGINGLTGIPVKSDKIIRPLSPFRRREILQYAKKEKLEWREDSSNSSADYLRNRIRQKLTPLLMELQPEFPEIMMKNFEYMRQTAAIQNEFTEEVRHKHLQVIDKNHWKINIKSLVKEEDSRLKLQLLLQSMGIKSKDLSSMLQIDKPGKQYYSGEYRLLRDRNILFIEKDAMKNLKTLAVSGKEGEIHFGGQTFQFEKQKFEGEMEISADANTHQLDLAKLKFPLLLRLWKAGDIFFPLGMNQRKKVSDFLIDKKINRFEKEKCLVLLSGKDIVCILGLRIDNRFKISNETKNIYSITLNKE